MKRAKIFLAIFSTILVLLWLLPGGIVAQDVNKVALVIRHSDQSVQTACVEFTEPEINGLDILQRSGFDMQIDVQGLGAAVCSIEQTGCPPDDCWCQCKGGGDCVYWSYWQKLNDQWQYSLGGASTHVVGDGDVQGWSWGPGAINAAFPPPDTAYSDICTSSVVDAPTATASPTAESIVFVPDDTPTSAPVLGQPVNIVTATPLPTSTIPPTATAAALATAAPTITVVPAATATAVPVATEQPINAPLEPESLAGAAASVSEPPAVVDQTPEPTATLDPTPLPLTKRAQNEAAQPAPEVVAVVAVALLPTRPPQRDIKNLVEKKVELDQELTVVGAAVQVPDLRVMQPGAENKNIAVEDENGAGSLFSYAVFGFIVLVLVGLLSYSSSRRRGKLYASSE